VFSFVDKTFRETKLLLADQKAIAINPKKSRGASHSSVVIAFRELPPDTEARWIFSTSTRRVLNQCRDTPHEPKTLLMIKKKTASETKTIDSNLKPMGPQLQNNAVYLENNQSEPTARQAFLNGM
jgi:hypothetical protein